MFPYIGGKAHHVKWMDKFFPVNFDKFVEVCMGKHGRPSFKGGYSLGGSDIEELDLTEYVSSVCEYLVGLSEEYDPKMDSDLLNIRDEMLAEINQLKYLLTLK